MRQIKHRVVVILVFVLVCMSQLAGCTTQAPQTGSPNAAPADSPAGTAPLAESPVPSDAQNAPQSSPTSEAPKNATWVIDINDTQHVTDELGIIWNYTLTFHASKPGGTDVLGEYAGEAVLKIEPDFDSVKAAAAAEGTELLSMLFNYHAECDAVSFEVFEFSMDKFAELMKEHNPDNPLSQFNAGDATDFFTVGTATFNSTQEPVSMTIQTDEGPFSGSGGGGGITVNVPFDISVDGATAYIYFYSMPHPGVPGFKGTITGDVLPG
jgi:hypothetical protein